MSRPRILDTYCKQGGAGMGYHRAGFDVVGVDLEPQPRYPFEFIQMDALEFLADGFWTGFDAIHASPPCQAYTALKALQGGKEYPDLLAPTRDALKRIGLPYVIENVVGAPMENAVQLCGSSFGRRIRRHRLFECSFPVMVAPCDHSWQQDKIYPALNGDDRKRGGRSGIVGVYGNGGDKRADLWPEAMGIDWMDRDGLTQAIPPDYTEHIGAFLLDHLSRATLEKAA